MKQLIAILRLLGIISLAAFIILTMLNYSSLANIILVISINIFGLVVLLQLYRFYIGNYMKQEDIVDN